MLSWVIGLIMLTVKFVFPILIAFVVVYFGWFYREGDDFLDQRKPKNYYMIFNVPNLVTTAGIILIPLGLYFFINGNFVLTFYCFFLSAISDAFDGYLAKVLNQRTRVGEFLDPLRDRILLLGALWILFDIIQISKITVFLLFILLLAEVGIVMLGALYPRTIKVHSMGKSRQAIHLFFIFLLFLNKFDLVFWEYLGVSTSYYSQIIFLMALFSLFGLFVYWKSVKNE